MRMIGAKDASVAVAFREVRRRKKTGFAFSCAQFTFLQVLALEGMVR